MSDSENIQEDLSMSSYDLKEESCKEDIKYRNK